MKLFKSFATVAVASVMFFISSCNSGETKTDETMSADSTVKKEEAPPPPAAPAKPANVMLVWHKVANFAKWLPLYESDDSARTANGLHNYIVARGAADSNMVMVAMRMDDAAKAKAFAADPRLKTAMQKGGVTGTPKMMYIDVQTLDTAVNASTRVMRTVKVKDYDVWKKAFDENKKFRMDAGLTDRTMGYSVGDNHTVTIVYAVSDRKKAEAYFNSPELKERMKTSGVEGTPESFWYNVTKKY